MDTGTGTGGGQAVGFTLWVQAVWRAAVGADTAEIILDICNNKLLPRGKNFPRPLGVHGAHGTGVDAGAAVPADILLQQGIGRQRRIGNDHLKPLTRPQLRSEYFAVYT